MENNQTNEREESKYELKRRLKRRWTYPFLYLALAAVVLTFVMWGNSSRDLNRTVEELALLEESKPVAVDVTAEEGPLPTALIERENKAVPANAPTVEKMILPFVAQDGVKAVLNFYEPDGIEKERAASLVKYDNTFWPHTGVDWANANGRAFDVVAAMSGRVIKAEKSPTVGQIIELEHHSGLKTIYQSLENVKVKVNDVVKQGDIIAASGRNLFEKDLGNHLHFEVHVKGKPVSPIAFIESQ
jgi:stage II sporulation protein Q